MLMPVILTCCVWKAIHRTDR